jgi:N-acetylglucosaminyl-diphospho-decaprenol L-rhamnosyltransferase
VTSAGPALVPTAAGPAGTALFPPVHVVIVHHDKPQRCAESVAAFLAQGPQVTVTVVDSGSGAAAAAALRALLPDADIIDAGANVGFGPGANIGWREWLGQGKGEWVAVAPHDALPRPGCLELLFAQIAGRPDAGLVCAEFGPEFDLVPAVDWILGGFYKPADRGVGWQDVDYPHGTLLLARRATLEQIGLFDERYFAYCEEVDLSLRARAAGWRVGMVWGAVVDNGQLPAQLLADYLQTRNTLLLVRTRFGRYAASVHAVLAVARTVGRIRRDRTRWRSHLLVEGQALADFLRGRFGPPSPALRHLAAAGEAGADAGEAGAGAGDG